MIEVHSLVACVDVIEALSLIVTPYIADIFTRDTEACTVGHMTIIVSPHTPKNGK